MKLQKLGSNKGFTLIELLLYVGISSLILFSISLFMTSLLDVRAKSQVMTEVESQGELAMATLLQAVRSAASITTPTTSATSSSLVITTYVATSSPTTFAVSSSSLTITQGAGSAIAMTNSRVSVTNLLATNLTQGGTPGSVQVRFTITALNPEGRTAFDYSKTFIGSASLRQP